MAKKYKIQLYDMNGAIIQSTGGVVKVCVAGDAVEQAVTNKAGTALTNPVALSNGEAEFYTANSVNTVDIYLMAPGGQFIIRRGVNPGQIGEIAVDTDQTNQVAVIPFSADDAGFAAATEIDTGFDMPVDAVVLPDGIGVDVSSVDASETVDVGLLSSESGGDANGFLSLLDVAVAIFAIAKAVVTTGSNEVYAASTTLGAMLVDFNAGTDVATDVGIHAKKGHRCDGVAESVTYTPTAGSDTVEGFIKIPYVLNL